VSDEEQPYSELIRYGVLVLLAAAAVDVVAEMRRAQTALHEWICRGTPTPGGPAACENAFLLRWMTAHLPLYVVAVGAVALVAGAASLGLRAARSQLPRAFPWNRLLRSVAVVVCLIALSELIACAGDATCGLSVSCT
jgi:hypothetical protein